MNPTRSVIDVSELPRSALDHRSPIWIGNALLLAIETTMFAILAASYFYLRQNFEDWPPPQVNFIPPNLHPTPDLFWGTANLVVILAATFFMFLTDRAAVRFDKSKVLLWGSFTVVLGILAVAFRFREFHGTQFRWDDNAYASVVWGILLMHLIHLFVGISEDGFMFAYIMKYGMDDKHARDVRVTAVYWYWIGGIWLPLYAIIYFGPYWIGK
ncbi:MAG TPA: cytochrome c oxidase subunit 3 [Chthoniobacterales bacterium]|jgi:heme/copper-type cytochrome/quinol oxidase subunit 3|nr:cytochrome c oxidase subunit 3 [Chthoniobacterales bacterium]